MFKTLGWVGISIRSYIQSELYILWSLRCRLAVNKISGRISDDKPPQIKILKKKNMKVKSMQRSGTEAIRTQIQLSKLKREITSITNSQNTKRTYGQPSEQLFPKRWPLSNNMNTHKVKRHRNSDTKNWQQRTTTKLPPQNGQ